MSCRTGINHTTLAVIANGNMSNWRREGRKSRLLLSPTGGYMKKSVSRALYLLALLLDIAGIVVFVYGAGGGNMNTFNSLVASGHLFVSTDMNNSMLTGIGALLVAAGSLLAFIAWIGALIKTARLGRWGWFVFLLIFSGITMLLYIFAGPTTSTRPAFSNAFYGGQPR